MNQHFQNIIEKIYSELKLQSKSILIRILSLWGVSSKERQLHNISIAVEAIKINKLKSVLTALGIIFGVAAVISMLAIGKGAKHEILEQIEYVGVNNIFIEPLKTDVFSKDGDKINQQKHFSKGLTIYDVESITDVIPSIRLASPEIEYSTNVIYNRNSKPANLIGVNNSFFEIYNFKIIEGNSFHPMQEEYSLPVCLISTELKNKLFKYNNPLNQYLKCGRVWLKVIGIYEKKEINTSKLDELNVNFNESNIYIPVKTMLLRFFNRSVIKTMQGSFAFIGSAPPPEINQQQLDRIVVQVYESGKIKSTAHILKRMLKRRHSNTIDCKVLVPELLIKQQQKTKSIFNFVLGSIAAISLLVGGIGIMNIMYASVLERIKEIGIRMTLGARRTDIMIQFIAEAILICFAGGIIGVALGTIIAKIIMHVAGIKTIISLLSVIVAFTVSVCIGIIFGFAPARKASQKDPIELLRYE